jgi:hypothetical protein
LSGSPVHDYRELGKTDRIALLVRQLMLGVYAHGMGRNRRLQGCLIRVGSLYTWMVGLIGARCMGNKGRSYAESAWLGRQVP